MVAVKCCGLKRLADAELCLQAGAVLLGVIRVEGTPRFQERAFLKQVVNVCQKSEVAEAVAVYQDAPIADIVQDVKETQVSLIQLHGTESPQYIHALQKVLQTPVAVWKVFDALNPPNRHALEAYANEITGVLFDVPKTFKGTQVDWHTVETALTEAIEIADTLGFTTCLAGKLTAENLPEVMTRFWVDAVDVASGIEDPTTGFKEAKKVEAFIATAQNRAFFPKVK